MNRDSHFLINNKIKDKKMKNNITYNADWKKLSKKILAERRKCELCKIRGIDKDSEETHHIFKFAE